MTGSPTISQPNNPPEQRPRDTDNWARPVGTLSTSDVPAGAIDPRVEGRHLVGPLQGFGPMWQKTYRVRLDGASVSPTEVIKAWKENFPSFWPAGNRFYGPLARIAPGDVAVLNLAAPGGMTLSTGIMVIYADDESFTFMTPEGHMLSAWITFSAYRDEGCTVAQAQALLRAPDPLMEVSLRLGGHRQEDTFWRRTLISLAEYFGVAGQVDMQSVCVDPRLQWSQAGNIRHNVVIRSMLYTMGKPVRLIRRGPR
jgi:hypothetical protein